MKSNYTGLEALITRDNQPTTSVIAYALFTIHNALLNRALIGLLSRENILMN